MKLEYQLFHGKECALAKVVNTKSDRSHSIAVKHITEDVIDRQSVNAFKTQHSSTQSQTSATLQQQASTNTGKTW